MSKVSFPKFRELRLLFQFNAVQAAIHLHAAEKIFHLSRVAK